MRPLLLLSAALLLASCSGAKHETTQSSPPSAVPVTTVIAAEQSWPSLYEATGTVRARTSAVISTRTTGYVREVRVQEGDRVREGQILVTLDARDLDVSVSHAQAALDEIRSAIPEADNTIAAAQANLDLARSTFRRIQELFEKRSVSNQEFDEASAKVKAADAQLAVARARRAQLDSQAARVEQDVRASEVARTWADIAAPFAGIVTVKSVEPGATATPGAPLLTIEREGAYRLEAAVEESKIAVIRIGQSVTVTLDAAGRPFASRVSEILPVVDAASRSYTVKIDLPALPSVRSGVFGRASFPLGERRALAIPVAAVRENGQLQSVFVVENGVARLRLITMGNRSGSDCEVLSGLATGEKVISPIPVNLADGAPVEVQP